MFLVLQLLEVLFGYHYCRYYYYVVVGAAAVVVDFDWPICSVGRPGRQLASRRRPIDWPANATRIFRAMGTLRPTDRLASRSTNWPS